MSTPLSLSITNKLILDSSNYTRQEPSGQGLLNAIPIKFGAEETTTDGELKLYSDGVLELLNNNYEYYVDISITMGRDSSQGLAELYAWYEVSLDGINYVQPPDSNTLYVGISDLSIIGREQATLTIPRSVGIGTKFRFMFGRSESGVNQGSLITKQPTGEFASLQPVASATLRIRRITAP